MWLSQFSYKSGSVFRRLNNEDDVVHQYEAISVGEACNGLSKNIPHYFYLIVVLVLSLSEIALSLI